ncbi:serine hydrolase domain-containing protein [Bradyrhizobium acaciae]|uniref:serine hydrolase domain-containing protein n=1 Tax=Bradyrhizobium acaciae TaxID=2683706 RepID=UPI001E59E4AC|nr:serine hydrolase [Bradyrhizobium acaciae]MCC8982778.1 serine hydrolase [Bradyrhizobium acaciae]
MYIRQIVFAVVLLGALVRFGPAEAEDGFPAAEWERVTPAESGWSETVLAQARSFSDQIRSSAVVIVQHGKVVAEWGNTTKPMELASIRKSLLSALIGIAVSDHLINLDSTLGELGIDDNPPGLTGSEKGATVRELLEARSGVYHAALYETPNMAKMRPPRGSHPPGTFWYYNNWDFNTLGTIYEHATGSGIFEAFDQKIAKPIGMQDYREQDGSYVRGEASIHPAYAIRMSARDLARFALFYLHKGNWAGHQIVPREWVEESTRSYSRAASGQGYGYLWWIGFLGGAVAPTVTLPRGSFLAEGFGGQYALVVPALDLVVVHRVDQDTPFTEPSMRSIGRLFWLILKAEGYDPGPDASLTAATGERPTGETLAAKFQSKTISFGNKLRDGPRTMRFEPDGRVTYTHRDEALGPTAGTWTVMEDKLCILILGARRSCYIPVLNGEQIELFDQLGVMQIAGVAQPQ